MIVLSMAPLPGELVAAFIRQTPGVPEFEVIAGHDMTDADLRDAAARADVILGDFTFRRSITAEIAAAARKVTLIQQPSVGYQHIDVEACTARRIRVANTAGANTESVAEHTVAWGLCLLKNMFYAHKATRQCRWEQMGVKPAELRGRVWGIVGFGRIGRAVASGSSHSRSGISCIMTSFARREPSRRGSAPNTGSWRTAERFGCRQPPCAVD